MLVYCWNTMNLFRALPIFVVLGAVLAADKQIKLEDIEKDNLKADQQAKFEKQYQAFQQYQFQQPGLNYQQQPSIAYQPQQAAYQPQQQQYTLPYIPQQYLQQLYQGNYQSVGNNAIAGYQQQAPVHPFQNYFSQQLQQVPVPGSQTHAQPQGVIMSYSAPSLAAFQQQAAAYYHHIAPNAQVPQYYFPQQQSDASPVPPTLPQQMTYTPQQYVPPFQSLSSVRAPTGVQYSENSVSTPFATASPYTSQNYNQQEVQNYLKQSAASLGQQKQYLQAVSAVSAVSTVSPPQAKYINSPQYLAQNYNTIPSTYLLLKSTYSGLKPTATPSVKIATQGGFLPSNPLSSSSTNYQNYRSISG